MEAQDSPEEIFVSQCEVAPGIVVVTINRPARRNALNLAVKKQLGDIVEMLDADQTTQVIVVTGAGGYFVAGTDIAEMAGMTPTEHTLLVTDRMFTILRKCRKPLIAAVEAYALGGGCELALSCDLIVAGNSARFGQPEIAVGIMPGAGATQRLVRIIGKYRTLRMVMTGDPITAIEAHAMGLLSDLVADGETLNHAVSLAKKITAKPPLAIRAIKEIMQLGEDAPLETALLLERKAFQLLFDTADQKEGMQAFLEKRSPLYKGK